MARLILAGRPQLILEDRGPGCSPDTRWRAYLKGRTAGGYLTDTAPTAEQAAEKLIATYEAEIAAIRAGIVELRAMRFPRRRR